MFTSSEIKNLPVGDSLTKLKCGFEITLTRDFSMKASLENKLSIVITPKDMRSDDEWSKRVPDADAANTFIQNKIGYRLRAA